MQKLQLQMQKLEAFCANCANTTAAHRRPTLSLPVLLFGKGCSMVPGAAADSKKQAGATLPSHSSRAEGRLASHARQASSTPAAAAATRTASSSLQDGSAFCWILSCLCREQHNQALAAAACLHRCTACQPLTCSAGAAMG